MEDLPLLILGAGWTATFLIPLLQSHSIPFAATTTTGRPITLPSGGAPVPTLPFRFDPSLPRADVLSALAALPRARAVLVTFPLKGSGPSELLVTGYRETHGRRASTSDQDDDATRRIRFIQLGSTGIWRGGGPTVAGGGGGDEGPWMTRRSEYERENPRAVAEDELLSLGGCVLNLAGLWDEQGRNPRNWVGRVAGSREAVKGKGSLHLVHGVDVARGVLAVATSDEGRWESAGRGQRWMLTDGFVYDWWALLAGWADAGGGESKPSEQAGWVMELMREEGVRALPRSMEVLGRCYDTREFWETWGLVPLKGGVH